jgi:uncharacterized protein YbjT (DUF2867 family)
MILVTGATGNIGSELVRALARSGEPVRDSRLPWTFPRSFGFMSNALQWIGQLQAGDVVRAPWPDVPIAVIDPHDIAAVAAVALTSAGHAGRAYTLSGPEPLRPADRVAILGEVLGRPLAFEAQPDDEARAEMSKAMPAEYVAAFFRFYSDGTLTSNNLSAERAGLRATRKPARRPAAKKPSPPSGSGDPWRTGCLTSAWRKVRLVLVRRSGRRCSTSWCR